MSDNLSIWKKFHRPPASALKPIKGGRLSGKSDINPQWRYEAMTEAFGPCGVGWKVEVARLWTEKGHGDEVFAFAQISLFVACPGPGWSDPIPGIGGSMLIASERQGQSMHNNDEAFKMAVTDALGTAMKLLGVAAEVYKGNWDGTKYKESPQEEAQRLKDEHDRQQQAASKTAQTADPAFKKAVSDHIDLFKQVAATEGLPGLQKAFNDTGETERGLAIRNAVIKTQGEKWWKALKAQAQAVRDFPPEDENA